MLGSGIMGSRIACHFANIGVPVILLDIPSKEADPKDHASRNKIVNDALKTCLVSKPSPIYSKKSIQLISTGNFDDDLKLISDCDWVIEVVIERLDIKKSLLERVEEFRKPGTLISSNTSGIPIHLIAEGRSDEFRKHFCGTHFFNPPRYLKLLEIIPGPDTDEDVLEFLIHYGDLFLGKTTVKSKDTPAFIANRIGVYSMMSAFHLTKQLGLTIDEVDKLTGPVLGRPKSASYRTCDVVGLDTLVKVAAGVEENCPEDEAIKTFKLPGFIEEMMKKQLFGDKTGKGFYKKIKTPEGGKEILSLNLDTLEYEPRSKAKFQTLELTKSIDNLKERYKVLYNGKDKAGEFYRLAFHDLLSYSSNRLPEVSDSIADIDAALRAGFGWELGPFESWDALGNKEIMNAIEASGSKVASWVHEMFDAGFETFYKTEKGKLLVYEPSSKTYVSVYENSNLIILDPLRETKTVWKNSGVDLIDIGDGILNLEFHTKMNTIGSDVVMGIMKSIEIAEKDFKGLVIGNEGQNYSAGANLGLVYMYALEQEFDEIDFAIRAFQNATMRIRYSSIPVVTAPFNLTLGGGCEMNLHADSVQAHAETYMGLVEFGVGLIPGGGGTKELTLRFSDSIKEGDMETNSLRNQFLNIGMAKVSTSAEEAFEMGLLRYGQDNITMNRTRLLTDAKSKALELADAGYSRPIERKDIRVLGRTGLGVIYAGANSMFSGNYISEHDKLISQKLGYIMCGGDLSGPTNVSEKYLLDLEREAFLSLCGERKTLERIKSILTTGKPLRN